RPRCRAELQLEVEVLAEILDGENVPNALADVHHDDAVRDLEALVGRFGFARQILFPALDFVVPAGEILAVKEAGVALRRLEVLARLVAARPPRGDAEEKRGHEPFPPCLFHRMLLMLAGPCTCHSPPTVLRNGPVASYES